jgi:hypothetical protein
VNKLTFTNMDTISAQLVEGMKDPYLLSEAVELVFHQGLNPAWMVLFAHLCRRLTKDSPFFGRRGEIVRHPYTPTHTLFDRVLVCDADTTRHAPPHTHTELQDGADR